MKLDFKHESVLLKECIDGLNIKPDGIYIDGTCGGAGHSTEIAKNITTGTLIAVDKDDVAIEIIKERLTPFSFTIIVKDDFKNIPSILDRLHIPSVDGILLDLGVSSYQLDTPERGFSYRFDAPLDMRMSSSGISAYDVINTYSHGQLVAIFRNYGEEKFSPSIARHIIAARENEPVKTTLQLVELIKAGIPAAKRREGGHPAKRVFQAIRIEVNDELNALKQCIDDSFDRLNPGGRFVIITFHSLEDRIVKHRYKELSTGCTCPPKFPVCVCGNSPKGRLISRKPILPTPSELEVNPRSQSAKLRILEKI